MSIFKKRKWQNTPKKSEGGGTVNLYDKGGAADAR